VKTEAVVFTGAGGVDVIALGTTEVRDPGPGEIQVEVVAAGLNRADVLQRRGFYPAPPGTVPDVPGLEFAGTVAARGPGATAWEPGARVMAVVPGGAMARRITLHEREAMPVPAGMALTDAAAIPEAFATAADAFARAGLAAGETVVVHAAASGVGTAALQLARAAGARPIATSRHADKLAALVARGLGATADDTIAVAGATFAAFVHARTGGRGAEVVLDCVGAAYLEENLRALAVRGRMVVIGTLGGATGTIPLGALLARRLTVIGTVMRARPLEEKIAVAQGVAARLVPLFERGALRPVVDAVVPMRDVADAHRRMEANETVGKLVLAW
jgi:putative PIG3 family NAD(P)H quinone oxidoreductase